jgi:hypothetical protein
VRADDVATRGRNQSLWKRSENARADADDAINPAERPIAKLLIEPAEKKSSPQGQLW